VTQTTHAQEPRLSSWGVAMVRCAMARTANIDLDAEAAWLSENDRLETIARCLREAFLNTLRTTAWPAAPTVLAWHMEAYVQRMKARHISEELQRPRRLAGIRIPRLFRAALRSVANEHAVAVSLAPTTPQAQPPQALPESCSLKVRQLLEVGVAGPFRLDLTGGADLGVIDMGVRR
jgi:hypothetical protein